MSKTYTFTKSYNVCRCLALHLLESGSASFGLCHSPCSRMRKVRFCGGVRVHIIIDDKLVIYGSFRTCVRHFNRLPHMRRPLIVFVPFRKSLMNLPALRVSHTCLLHIQRDQRYFLAFRLVFTGFSDAVEASTVGSLKRHLDIKFRHRLWFLLWLFLHLHLLSCVLFDITSWQLVELEWLVLNKKTKDGSTHHVWNFPLLVCLRFGFWCQWIWFESWVQIDSIE